MENFIQSKFILLDLDLKSKDELFSQIAKIALKEKMVKTQKALINAFNEREKLESTAFEDEFAIPHARSQVVTHPGCFFVRFKEPITWDEDKKVQQAILLLIPEKQGDYLDILSGIATKLMDTKIREVLKTSNSPEEIAQTLAQKTVKKQSVEVGDHALTVVGITACATGVAHTYMARDALLEAGKKLNWNVYIESQGQKGQDFPLTTEQIQKADAVVIACDISVELDRFTGKKIYHTGTKQAIDKPVDILQTTISKGKVANTQNGEIDAFAIKDKRGWVKHIMNGISYMIPFIVFAGIISAILSGITSAAGIDIKPDYKDLTGGTLFLKILNDFAGIGFTVMMGVAGAYIANSIAGRAAIAPAFILTMMGNRPELVWQGYFRNVTIDNPFWGMSGNTNPEVMSLNALMQPLNIFGAVIFGLAVGYTVRWINTKWKINRYIQPIMPIIIIPVFLTLIFGVIWMFTFGPLMGLAVGYLNFGIMKWESTNQGGAAVGMMALGLVLGLLAGVDMGGPINKIASFGSTALIPIDNGLAMGAAAAAFAVAPLGCGITALIFRSKFKDDKTMAINTSILGFMGISEGAIPFAAKYGWPVFAANIIGSGVTGMIAGAFMVQGHVGAWGGPIIAVFAGVTDNNSSFIGILWFLIAIAAGTLVHIVLFRLFIEIKTSEHGILTKEQWKTMFTRNKKVTETLKK